MESPFHRRESSRCFNFRGAPAISAAYEPLKFPPAFLLKKPLAAERMRSPGLVLADRLRCIPHLPRCNFRRRSLKDLHHITSMFNSPPLNFSRFTPRMATRKLVLVRHGGCSARRLRSL